MSRENDCYSKEMEETHTGGWSSRRVIVNDVVRTHANAALLLLSHSAFHFAAENTWQPAGILCKI